MKLDRESNPNRKGKYAIIKLRGTEPFSTTADGYVMVPKLAIDFGERSDNEFFVIRLKDAFAKSALQGYRAAVSDACNALSTASSDLIRTAGECGNTVGGILRNHAGNIKAEADNLHEWRASIDGLIERASVIVDTKFPD